MSDAREARDADVSLCIDEVKSAEPVADASREGQASVA
jgi:hypothetical protein